MSREEELFERCMREFPDGLDELSGDMLRKYCKASSRIEELNELLDEQGMFIETIKGPKENPAINVIHKLTGEVARFYTPLKRLMAEQRNRNEHSEMDSFLFDD